MAQSPISRVGGKFYLAKQIVPLFPEHSRYIEPFGGAMHVMFRKAPSKMEIYNDIDSNLFNFFQVVRSQPEALLKKLEFTNYSRELFLFALSNLNTGTDVERACNFYIVNRQCFGGKMKSWGITASGCKGFFKYDERIREAHARLKDVHIENLDWREVIRKYDCPEALFYLDPPYMFNENRGNDRFYTNEMTNADHAELVEVLKGIKGKFLLSGYANSLYDCFDKVDMGESNMCINATDGSRLKKQEFVWKNY